MLREIESSSISPLPSFLIKDSTDNTSGYFPWDRLNSKEIIRKGREAYFNFIANASVKAKPKGVILNLSNGKGLIVFKLKTLLPNEIYLPIGTLINSRSSKKAKDRITSKNKT
tara:strand:+ start:295 stop:633 length:339 start_codon:yes stop_codon:yes gene_type:complete